MDSDFCKGSRFLLNVGRSSTSKWENKCMQLSCHSGYAQHIILNFVVGEIKRQVSSNCKDIIFYIESHFLFRNVISPHFFLFKAKNRCLSDRSQMSAILKRFWGRRFQKGMSLEAPGLTPGRIFKQMDEQEITFVSSGLSQVCLETSRSYSQKQFPPVLGKHLKNVRKLVVMAER